MPSTRQTAKQPASQRPEFFVDRDLGRDRVPKAIRELGYVVHPLHEVYGDDLEQSTKDPDWIALAAQSGWVCLCRDKLRHPREREAVVEHNARIFRVARSAITADQEIAYIRKHIRKIERLARKPGPYIYRIEWSDVVRVFPPSGRSATRALGPTDPQI